MINDVAALETPDGQLSMWMKVAVFDERPGVRKVAFERITALGSKRDLSHAKKKRRAVERETAGFEKKLLTPEREFKSRIRRLFLA